MTDNIDNCNKIEELQELIGNTEYITFKVKTYLRSILGDRHYNILPATDLAALYYKKKLKDEWLVDKNYLINCVDKLAKHRELIGQDSQDSCEYMKDIALRIETINRTIQLIDQAIYLLYRDEAEQ